MVTLVGIEPRNSEALNLESDALPLGLNSRAHYLHFEQSFKQKYHSPKL